MSASRYLSGCLSRALYCVLGRFHALRADTCGAAVVLAAILFPVVIGGMGLGAETGYWYMTQRKIQHAADVAAHAAGARLRAGDSKEEIRAAAVAVAAETGVDVAAGPGPAGATATMVVNAPYANDALKVEVMIALSQPRMFSSIFSDEPVAMGGRAVAQVSKSESVACVLALSTTAAAAVEVAGSTNVALEGCDVASNSNAASSLHMSGTSSALTVECIQTVGGANTNMNLNLTSCSSPTEYAPAVRDPYATVLEPSRHDMACGEKKNWRDETLEPTTIHSPSGEKAMIFCNGLNVRGNILFKPGLYIIDGDFTINAGNVDSNSDAVLNGEGVTFYLTAGSRIRFNGNATLNLAAPNKGVFSGILFYGSRAASGGTQRINGNSQSTLHGAIYMPKSHVEYRGNSKSSGGCTQIVGERVIFSGNSSLQSSCTSAGTRDILSRELVTLVE